MTEEKEFEFLEIAPAAELPINERLFVEIGGQPIVILNLAGQLYAIGDVCSHDNGPVGDGEVIGMEIVCPRHGARFDIRSGKATRLPAVRDIPAYPVKVEKGKIFIGIKKQPPA